MREPPVLLLAQDVDEASAGNLWAQSQEVCSYFYEMEEVKMINWICPSLFTNAPEGKLIFHEIVANTGN